MAVGEKHRLYNKDLYREPEVSCYLMLYINIHMAFTCDEA